MLSLGQLVADEEGKAPIPLFPLCHFLQGPWYLGYRFCLNFLAYIKEVTLLPEFVLCEAKQKCLNPLRNT